MFFKKLSPKTYLIRIKRGEKIIESLNKFCQKKKIFTGFFYGIGAVDQAEIAHYDVGKKKYSSKKFNLAMEMANITGNIGIFEKGLIIHAHATFSDVNMKALTGHLVEARISGTAEIHLASLPKINKLFDKETGLKLFNLPQLD